MNWAKKALWFVLGMVMAGVLIFIPPSMGQRHNSDVKEDAREALRRAREEQRQRQNPCPEPTPKEPKRPKT
jgi:hypothetical protein